MKYALFDLSLCAPAFDFVQFCIVSKAQCAAMGEECRIVFKKGPDQGFKEPNDKAYSVEEKKFRMNHILYPICTMMGLDYSTDIFSDIEESQILNPEDNSYIFLRLLNQYKKSPLFWPQPSDHAMEMVRKAFPELPVVITLRETYSEDRNSNVEEWIKFAQHVGKTNLVIFVRDTAKWSHALTYGDVQYYTFSVASIDLDMRLALYKHAKINFSVGGGPTCLLRFSTDIPYRIFKMSTKDKFVKSIFSKIKELRPEKQKLIKDSKIIHLSEESGGGHITFDFDEISELKKQGLTKFTVKDSKGNDQVIYLKDKYTAASPTKLAEIGFPVGSQLPWHTENQKIIWEDDKFENLKREYDKWREVR